MSRRAAGAARRPGDGSGSVQPECVVLSGGITGGPPHAVAGTLTWHKGKREKLGDFIERAKTEARAAGMRRVIVRGLKW